MAVRMTRIRPRTSHATRLVAGGLLLLAVRTFGPAYTVKGSWEGSLDDVKSLPKGLEPTGASGASFSGNKITLSLEDGVLKAKYADGPLSLSMSDSSAWQANFTDGNSEVKLDGDGSGSMTWEASKTGSVKGLGDVELDVNSDGELEVKLAPPEVTLGDLVGLKAALSSADGIGAVLEAAKTMKDLDLKYKVENSPGDYDLANLKHVLTAASAVAGGAASAAYTYDDAGQNYNVTYTKAVAGGDASLEYSDGAAGQAYNVSFVRALADADVTLGADADGAYGAMSASQALGDIAASLDVSGRVVSEGNMSVSHAEALKLAHKLGTVTISSADGGDVDVDGDFVLEQKGNKLSAKVGYTVGGADPTYNVTFSRDLSDVLKSAGGLEVGVDNAGAYGSVSASKDVGSGFGVDYTSSGRMDDLTHKLKLSNDLGYAELVKPQDEEARLRLGYEFDV